MLRRLWRYCDKIFKLTDHLAQLKNKGFTKKNNEPFITAILFMAMFMRLKSFNALEDTMKRNKKVWKKLLNTDYLPSIDTISTFSSFMFCQKVQKVTFKASTERENLCFQLLLCKTL